MTIFFAECRRKTTRSPSLLWKLREEKTDSGPYVKANRASDPRVTPDVQCAHSSENMCGAYSLFLLLFLLFIIIEY